MSAHPELATEVANVPESEHKPEPVSPKLQRVFDALAEASEKPLPRSRAQESSRGFWTIKPVR